MPSSFRSALVTALHAAVLAGLAASVAHAGSFNLRWNACWGDGGTMNRDFACTTNLGSEMLVASIVAPLERHFVSGFDATLEIAVAGTSLPPWWQFRVAGSCRPTGLSVNSAIPATAVHCEDWASGALTLLSGYQPDYWGSGTVHATISSVTPEGTTADLFPGHEYYLYSVAISHQKTVDPGACAGCGLGACLSFSRVYLNYTDGSPPEPWFPGKFESDDRLATWQGGAGVISTTIGGQTSCPRATPVRNSTWGNVKALYR